MWHRTSRCIRSHSREALLNLRVTYCSWCSWGRRLRPRHWWQWWGDGWEGGGGEGMEMVCQTFPVLTGSRERERALYKGWQHCLQSPVVQVLIRRKQEWNWWSLEIVGKRLNWWVFLTQLTLQSINVALGKWKTHFYVVLADRIQNHREIVNDKKKRVAGALSNSEVSVMHWKPISVQYLMHSILRPLFHKYCFHLVVFVSEMKKIRGT